MSDGSTKQVRIQYFAVLREQRGLAEEKIETSAQTLRQLYDELKERHSFGLPVDRLRVAVDDRFEHWDQTVCNHSRVVFVPPVAGG